MTQKSYLFSMTWEKCGCFIVIRSKELKLLLRYKDESITIDMYLQIWLPDVEVLNLKMFQALDVLSKLQGLWVSQNSDILYVLATRITFICAMSFDDFPLDTQTCLLQVSNIVNKNYILIVESYNISTITSTISISAILILGWKFQFWQSQNGLWKLLDALHAQPHKIHPWLWR